MRPAYTVGATSFVVPTGWLENAERLAGRVGDVELLLCEDPRRAGSAPGCSEVAGLARLASERGLGYTLHAPVETPLTSADEGARRDAVAQVLHAAALVRTCAPRAITVHLDAEPDPPGGEAAWRERAAGSLRDLIAGGLDPRSICVETLDARFGLVEPVIGALGVSVTLDLGHFAGEPARAIDLLRRHLLRARVIHWHGTDETGRDHRSLRLFPRETAAHVVRRLRETAWDGVLTLEVFSEADLSDSLAVLRELENG